MLVVINIHWNSFPKKLLHVVPKPLLDKLVLLLGVRMCTHTHILFNTCCLLMAPNSLKSQDML